MALVDATKPDDDTLVSDLPSYIRETREILNAAGIITVSTIEVNVSDPTPAVNGGIDIVNLIAPYAQVVDSIDDGTDGDIVVFYAGTSYVTIEDATGNISLKGNPLDPDFPMLQGDMLILIFRESEWKELYRVLV